MTGDSLYCLRNIRKDRGRAFSLQVKRLDIAHGQTLVLLGPTGAGKSTLLRLLAGLESPTAGEIRLDSCQLVSRKLPLPLRRRIAMVHQRPVVLSGSVRTNIEYGLRLRGTTNGAAKVDEVLDRLGLKNLASQNAQTLSGGQAQLVALARALVLSCDVLLLDEPTAHLDPAHVELVEQAIRRARADRPITVVWATHNLFQARRVATQVAFLWNGLLVEATATDKFFDSPADPRTADFVAGRMVY